MTASENTFKEEIIEGENESEDEMTVCNKRRKLSSDSDCIISKVEKKKNGLSKQGQKR